MQYFKNIKQDAKNDEKDVDGKDDKEEEEDDDKKEEKKEEKKEGDKEDKQERRHRNVPPLITTIQRKRPPMTRERWMEMAQIRRWSVRITNIVLQNLYKEPYDPFIEFVVGGDFRVIEKTVKKGKKENQYVGTLGYVKKTEVFNNLEPKIAAIYATRIACEFRGSYFDVQEQFLRVDIWDSERWNLNEFLGRIEIPIIEIIQGDVDQEFIINKAGEKKKIKLARLNFTISFQEIWDFELGFSDWSGNRIAGLTKEVEPSPSLRLSLLGQGIFSTKIKTKVIDTEPNPTWPLIKGTIMFRGTVNDLDNQKLNIEIFDGGLLNSTRIGSKVTDLKGILDSGVISTDVALKTRDISGCSCSIKGRINILRTPKYRQTGDIVMLNSEGQYLCVSVMRVDNIILANDKGVVNTFVEVSWGGYLKRTKTAFRTYKPIFNDTFYFPINVSAEHANVSTNKKIKAIMKELNLYGVIKFNFWSIDEQLSNDSVGGCNFFLSELQNAGVQEKEFFDEKTQNNSVMKVRVWSGKKQLTSPFIEKGEISNLFLEVWVLYEFEKKIEYDDLPKAEDVSRPDNYEKLRKDWILKGEYIRDAFPEETQREFICEAKDEKDREQFLPMFISKIGYPNPSSRLSSESEKTPIDYLKVHTLKECNYYTSLIPYSGAQNSIWTSPEFLIHMKKGEIEDHAIFLACLQMNVKYESLDDIPPEEQDSETKIETKRKENKDSDLKTDTKRKDHKQTISKLPETSASAMENRVFVCLGSLKQRKTSHCWVMTINSDFKGVTFWEASNNTFYELCVRVKSPSNLEKFLNKEEVESNVLKEKVKEEEKVEEVDQEEFNDKVENILDDNSENDQSDDMENDEKGINNKRVIKDIKITENELDRNTKFRYKPQAPKDELQKKPESNYLEKKKHLEENNPNNYLSLVQEPRILPGSNEVDLPYRTIDLIFNNKNIFMNLQHFDPSRIIYDIYDKSLWHPFVDTNFKAYSAFYPPPVMIPPFSLPQSKKLHNNIIKEMKIGISALRSGKNLGTSWKNQNDNCVELMEEHLVFLEKVARGEVEEDTIQLTKRDWSLKIRQFMPTLFRFSAYPAQFNYPEPDRIASTFIEKANNFFCMQYKDMKWAVAARIFPYVSKMISIRIMVACFYPVPDGSNKFN